MKHVGGQRSNRILILGGSGFLGNALYRELLSYFDVYGTYAHQEDTFGDNQVFFRFIAEEDDIAEILFHVAPNYIISAFKAPIEYQLHTLKVVSEYCLATGSKLIQLSSGRVFDARWQFPSYELDAPMSISPEGKQHIKLEKAVRELPNNLWVIARIPLVLGVNAPTIHNLKQAILNHAEFEIFPHLVVSTTTADRIAQQMHYIINKNLFGIFHLSSEDVIHHDDLFKEISEKISNKAPIFKNVYSSNEDAFHALLPKSNRLPKNYRFTVADVIDDSTLKDEIITLKNNV